jgi:light-regulated signal transduction histidine kinase (bacteriophytochrome)
MSNYIKRNYAVALETGMNLAQFYTEEYVSIWIGFYERLLKKGKFEIEMESVNDKRIINFCITPIFVDSELIEIIVFGKDITENKKFEREIVNMNIELENGIKERTKALQQSVQELSVFSSAVSHDLKTPLRAIENYATLIQNGAEIESNSLNIKRMCNEKITMIDKLLNYSKSTYKDVQKETVDIKKMVDSVYKEITESMCYTHAVLDYETGLPLVSADKTLINIVLCNVLSNALKFSKSKNPAIITVGCRAKDGEYIFYIKDNGVGFDMEYVNKLFNLFERLHSQSAFEGSGIGLATIKNIIQRHQGRTWIEGMKNEGAILYFTLPIQI